MKKASNLILPLALCLGTSCSFASDKHISDSLKTTSKSESVRTVQSLGMDGDSVILIQQLKVMTDLYGTQLKSNQELVKQTKLAEQRNGLLKQIARILQGQE